ncbi:MAG TPA: type III secretion inner membrane ring lipoprotein SctJ [Burkholderiaceae bacterium]|nr:type III secretion inner membrane ring lipoprotein SctJ [Burkholderiaceae bacterium]
MPAPHTMSPLARLTTAVLAAATLLLAACSEQELYGQLSERQANEMVAVLRGAGIAAEKLSQEGGKFSVTTSRDDFPQAVRTLNAQGYPRETFDNMGKVFKREGFVSSPLEERARLMHATSQEIANTIADIDGVVTARVHLVMPERNPLVDKPQPAAASVFIKHRPDKNLTAQIPQIKALVVNSIEGLSYDNVTVALFPADGLSRESAPTATPAAASAAAVFLPLLAGGLGGVLALGGGALLWWRRRRTPASTALTLAPPASAGKLPAPARQATDEAAAAFRRAMSRQ